MFCGFYLSQQSPPNSCISSLFLHLPRRPFPPCHSRVRGETHSRAHCHTSNYVMLLLIEVQIENKILFAISYCKFCNYHDCCLGHVGITTSLKPNL